MKFSDEKVLAEGSILDCMSEGILRGQNISCPAFGLAWNVPFIFSMLTITSLEFLTKFQKMLLLLLLLL